jgi:hypothetical protein
MPRFSQIDEAVLKLTMLPRAPDCIFTSKDVESIIEETGMDKEVIQHWARHLRWKMNLDKLPGSMSIEEFLKATPDSLSDKVT